MPMRPLLPALCAAALGFSGCGDEESAPTKAEFNKQATAICRKAVNEAKRRGREALTDPRNPKPRLALDVLYRIIPPLSDMVGDLRALERPDGTDKKIERILDAYDRALRRVGRIRDPARAIAYFNSTNTRADPFRKADRLAARYGLGCGD